MCTVTFIPTEKAVFLTSSRDEHINRHTLPPMCYTFNNQRLWFPKDCTAGGSWIVAGGDFRFACLLNGALERHISSGKYRKSRGLMVLDVWQFVTFDAFATDYDFSGIEPFTLLLLDARNVLELMEFRWDGEQLLRKKLATDSQYIWSSATLYSADVRQQRKQLFDDWLNNLHSDTAQGILHFHTNPHHSNPETDILMKRGNGLQTVSVTQLRIEKEGVELEYHDLIEQKCHLQTIERL